MSIFGNNLKSFRKTMGLTQQQLAEEIFVTPMTIRRYEAGTTKPSLSVFERIVGVYNRTATKKVLTPNLLFSAFDVFPDFDIQNIETVEDISTYADKLRIIKMEINDVNKELHIINDPEENKKLLSEYWKLDSFERSQVLDFISRLNSLKKYYTEALSHNEE